VALLAQITVFAEIALVLLIGLLFDIMNTWLTNAGIIKWYALKRGIR
jgi:preprotein translocase subunit SecF